MEHPVHVRLDGVLTIRSRAGAGLDIVREIFPTADKRAAMERITISNTSGQPVMLTIRNADTTTWGRGCNGVYAVESRMDTSGTIHITPGGCRMLGLTLSARVAHEPYERLDVNAQWLRRRARVEELSAPLQLETEIPEIDPCSVGFTRRQDRPGRACQEKPL